MLLVADHGFPIMWLADRSPMENHHLAASFQLVNSDEYNFMPKVGC